MYCGLWAGAVLCILVLLGKQVPDKLELFFLAYRLLFIVYYMLWCGDTLWRVGLSSVCEGFFVATHTQVYMRWVCVKLSFHPNAGSFRVSFLHLGGIDIESLKRHYAVGLGLETWLKVIRGTRINSLCGGTSQALIRNR